MRGIRVLQSWNCVLEDCKVAKLIDIAMLRRWEKAGKPPAGRKGTFDKAERVESAFALLSQKVIKAMRRIRRSLPDREKGKLIEADDQHYDRERLCQP